MKIHITQLFILLILYGLSTNISFAQNQNNVVYPGFYLGVSSGFGKVSYKNNFAPGYYASSIHKTGFANRIEAGFDITKHFGVLMSVIYFDKPKFYNINHITDSKIKNNLIYFALNGMLPISHRFVIYVSGGIGYIVRSAVIIQRVIVLSNQEIIRPVYGLGANYLIFKRWIATLTWIQAAEKTSDNLPTSNFFGVGIRYKFAS